MTNIDNNLAFLSSFISENMQALKKRKLKYCRATCPDPQCRIMMYFPMHEVSVECYGCGQRHSTASLPDRTELKEEEQIQKNLSEMKLLYGGKKTAELVKVKGISNYQCKLLSPLLTTHGKDRNDQPRPLKELGMGDVFDCSKLASRAFAIDSNLLNTAGYGEDKSGSAKYLRDTLQQLSLHNSNRKALVPVHADGDGHCLVHAISRCLVGRELFWHALRLNMQRHLQSNRDEYIALMKGFLSEEEWPEIVEEAAPDYQPPDGQPLGLRTVHIFALANVLHRPIILLDSLAGMHTKGEYSGIFLPALLPPDQCISQGMMNSPIVIAWSNAGYNHFIPLVPLKDEPLPKLPPSLRPEVWGVDESYLHRYITVENDGSIEMCRGKPLQDSYLQKLVLCMEQLFFSLYSVTPSLVADFNQHVYRSAGYVGMSLEMVTMETKAAVADKRLFRCLVCTGISCIPEDWLWKNGTLYNIAASEFSLKNGEKYTFPRYGITAEYNADKDLMEPFDVDCFLCKQTARLVSGDGTVHYVNGDRTPTRANAQFSKCCGYKHYWDGNEYDNLPEVYPLQLTWKGRQKTVKVYYFQNESDPSLNSNMYEVASKAVAENYPAEFGDEQLVQQVVEMLLAATESHSSEQLEHHAPTNQDYMETEPLNTADALGSSKAYATGMTGGTKVLHKEELGVSETERKIKKRVEDKLAQRRQQQQTMSAAQEQSTRGGGTGGGKKISPTPLIRDQPTASPPSKISATEGSPTPKQSPPSPSPLPSNTKRIKVTTSEGKTANLTLSNSASFIDLKLMIEKELGIPMNCQRLRWGFPPKELRPSEEESSSPLSLSHGERVSVEWVGQSGSRRGQEERSGSYGGARAVSASSQRALDYGSDNSGGNRSLTEQINAMLESENAFDYLQHSPHLFRKGGHCYEELHRSYGNKLHDGMHVQFAEIDDITFRFNEKEECLEVCLGVDHIPVGPMTKQQKELARLAATQNNDPKHGSEKEKGVESVKWMLNRPGGGGSNVKAFSGAGRTLGGGARSELKPSQFDSELKTLDQLLIKTRQVINIRVADLRSKEQQLQAEVRSLNQRLLDIQAGREDSSEGCPARDLETRIIDLSSELKLVREEIKQLSEL